LNFEKLQSQLIEHEGMRLKPYLCTAGKTSVGIGRNLTDKGISEKEALYLLHNDISECYDDLIPLFIDFKMMPDSIQRALLDMRFNLGHAGFRKFKKMITAVNNRNQENMIKEMLDSKWARQVPERVESLIKIIKGE